MRLIDLKLLYRDWRGGQLNLVISALVLAVTVVTAVSLFADRVERGILQQISQFLAADLAVRGGIEIDDQYRVKATELGLETADTASFRSMVFVGDKNHLAAVKAVSMDYPLRGQMELTSDPLGHNVSVSGIGPSQGEAWVEPRLLTLLDAKLGDRVEVGYLTLEITRLIINEPDRGTGFGGAGARIMISLKDLPASKLIRPGSRATYRLLMSGNESSISNFKQWYEDKERKEADELTVPHYRLLTPEGAEEQLGETFTRGRAFLLLSGTIGVLLAGLAMALASHRYANRLTDQVALMKAWGQPSSAVRRSQFVRLLMIALVATCLGILFGWLAHYFLLELAKGLLNVELPLPSWRPWIVASVTGVICVLGFALPALWHLPAIAPLKVLRRDLPTSLVSQGKRLWIGIAALFALTAWYSTSLVTASLFLGALFVLFAVCALVALQFLRLVKGFGAWQGSYVRLGLANLWRRRAQTLVQLVGFATTLMLLLIVTGMRTNLISEWEAQLPADTPSHFLFNVADAEVEGVREILAKDSLETTEWYPMVRGRLTHINGDLISKERLARSGGLSREVNLTQTTTLPPSNKIVAGSWWESAPEKPAFSMEEEVATELGVTLGDEITYSVGGLTFSATLTSLRSVNWQSMNPNFYVIFYPGALDKYAPNWVTAVKAGDLVRKEGDALTQQAPFIKEMVQRYPTAIVLELTDVVSRIRDVITRVTQGLELILLLVLACGAMVLFASIGVSFDERLRENAILRTLGSSKKVILGALTVEYAALGFVSGLIASMGAETVLYFVQTKVFDLSAQWHPSLWAIGIFAGVALIVLLGLLRSREIITVAPLESLRRLA
ncbi:ABC transporter permease [Arenicella sp. 4NH20-0111]|uniref:ABC transporter permease n=1 Tax=Arenicella sp. 4NH20-0111 TaxID=3127648 RepID=UPI003108FE7E